MKELLIAAFQKTMELQNLLNSIEAPGVSGNPSLEHILTWIRGQLERV